MSIIHDALKKVQQGLASKKGEIPVNPSPDPQTPGSLWGKPAAADAQPQDSQQISEPKSPEKNKITSLFALCLSIVITVVSITYIYKEIKSNFPKIQQLAKSSYYKLIHKKEEPEFKTKAPADLKPLAKITLNAPAGAASAAAQAPATTLNVHGIMSNGTGNLVLINDSVYQEGDEVEGAKIVKIDMNSITVINNGVEQTIRVKN